MLTIYDRWNAALFCDRTSRRSFLRIGSLASGGLTLARLLEAEAEAGIAGSNKSVITIFLPGGPPHVDMYDLKMDAPLEVRGEFRPISTSVPGIQISEWLPQIARVMDRTAIIRSICDSRGHHSDFQCMTGRNEQGQPAGGWPVFGSAVSRLLGSTSTELPAYIDLGTKLSQDSYRPAGFLGAAHEPYMPHQGAGREDLVLHDMTLDRLDDRRRLVSALDTLHQRVDAETRLAGFDAFRQQAFGILQSNRLARALDLEQEDRRVRERYGYGSLKPTPQAPYANQWLLMARRLVEAGVRVVSLSFGYWDWHGENLRRFKETFPSFDQCVSALIEDLYERGLDQDVLVLVWGEFGRSPKINRAAGREHWPPVTNALFSGGGLRTGQVIGVTDRIGAQVTSRPVTFAEVFATLYRHLGIDTQAARLRDLNSRDHPLAYTPEPITELVG